MNSPYAPIPVRPSSIYRHIDRFSESICLEPEPTDLEELEDKIFATRCWLAILAVSAFVGFGFVSAAILFLLNNRPESVKPLAIPVPPGVVEGVE